MLASSLLPTNQRLKELASSVQGKMYAKKEVQAPVSDNYDEARSQQQDPEDGLTSVKMPSLMQPSDAGGCSRSDQHSIDLRCRKRKMITGGEFGERPTKRERERKERR